MAEILIINQSFGNTLTSKFSNYLINNPRFHGRNNLQISSLVLSNDYFKQTIFNSMSIQFKEELYDLKEECKKLQNQNQGS